VTEAADVLAAAFTTSRRTAVVDVGANPIDGEPPYAGMLRRGLCTLVGFEPQSAALDALRAHAGESETYLPLVVGDGRGHTLRIADAGGMTSLLEPDPERLALFNGFREWGRVRSEEPVSTTRLDDIREVAAMDLLKIDVQGAEPIVFSGADRLLSEAVVVHTEVSFVTLYRGQPSFGEVDLGLRERGFVPHTFAAVKRWAIAPVVFGGNFRVPGNQLLEADVVYVRDFGRLDAMTEAQLQHLALLAHHVYGSVDLAHVCLEALARRDACRADAPAAYLAAVDVL
jgi:FkbM family methyltransferase